MLLDGVKLLFKVTMQYELIDPKPPREQYGELILPYKAIRIVSSIGEILTLSASDADNPDCPGNVCGVFTRRSPSGFIDGPFIEYRDDNGDTDIMPFGQMDEAVLFCEED